MFPDTQVTGQYPRGELAFLTSNSANTAPTEAMRIRGDLVGIGTTAPSYKLHSQTSVGSDFAGYFYNNAASGNGTSLVARGGANNSTPNFQVQDYNGNADFTVLGNGDVGIGITAPASKLHVETGTSNLAARISKGGNKFDIGGLQSGTAYIKGFEGTVAFGNEYAGNLTFLTANTERLRVTASGDFLIGTASTTSNERVRISNGNDTRAISFQSASAAECGYIYINGGGTSVTYSTSSDYRLKENVTAITSATDRLNQLNPVRFNFIADADTTVDGFLAHEVATVIPEAISGEKDEVDADGNAVMQGIDQSKLVPLLTAALQEALTKIDQLETRITALEA